MADPNRPADESWERMPERRGTFAFRCAATQLHFPHCAFRKCNRGSPIPASLRLERPYPFAFRCLSKTGQCAPCRPQTSTGRCRCRHPCSAHLGKSSSFFGRQDEKHCRNTAMGETWGSWRPTFVALTEAQCGMAIADNNDILRNATFAWPRSLTWIRAMLERHQAALAFPIGSAGCSRFA